MSANTTSTQDRRSMPWRARMAFNVGKTRRQRQAQQRQQTNALLTILVATLVASAVFVIANWRNGGATKAVSCDEFPEFCVPLAGGSQAFSSLEAASSRTLDDASLNTDAAPGVVRYVDQNTIVTIGDPDAPVHFLMVSDYACPHCQDYHSAEVPHILDDLVLTGKATFGVVLTSGTGRVYSELASQAALCAGESGAYWEMSEELFRLARSQGVTQAFSLSQIRQSAGDMGLDGARIVDCVTSNRYADVLRDYQYFAADNGVTATPTILASFGDTGQWRVVSRDLDTLRGIADSAAAQ